MKRIILLLLISGGWISGMQAQAAKLPCRATIREQMIRVADYQLAQPWPAHMLISHPLGFGDRSWQAGAYYLGIYEAYRTTGKAEYLERLFQVAEGNGWQTGPRFNAADDQAILQTYLSLYREDKQRSDLTRTDSTLKAVVALDSEEYYPWSWSDALFMAPAIFAEYAALTGDARYLDFLNHQWWKTVDDLYDPQHRLFYRDARFKTMQAANGEPIFWGRGSGWVIGGLARVLEFMPKDYPERPRYVALYRDFCRGIVATQQPDGFWKSSLLDPDSYPEGETSGTVFFCYGLAWGVNQGILGKKEYLPAIEKAWEALSTTIHPDGKLGYVQGGGDRPHPTTVHQTEFFGVGGFLLAGSEVIKLAPKRCKK